MILLLAWVTVDNPITDGYLSVMKGSTVDVSKQNDLYREIEEKAPNYEIKPSNAKIDPVWKAMPGYNGLKVDIEASYKKMKSSGKFDEDKLVFQQVKPEVHLTDLEPAAVYKGHPDKPMVSFIVNVAWGNEYLSSMLKTLKKHNVTATFFLEGRWVKENPDLAKMIASAGHEVGNHSYSHPNMKEISAAKTKKEIDDTNSVIEATTGKKVTWFAPPSGSYREETVKIAAALNLKTVMWSVDTIDWQKPTPDQLTQRVMSKIHNGAIVLMHPTDPTAKALDQLILQIKQKDLSISTLTKMISEERVLKNPVKENSNLGNSN